MKERILSQISALQGLLDQDTNLTPLDKASLTVRLAQFSRDYTHAHHHVDRVGRVDAGVDERARQAKLQGGVDAGCKLTVVQG